MFQRSTFQRPTFQIQMFQIQTGTRMSTTSLLKSLTFSVAAGVAASFCVAASAQTTWTMATGYPDSSFLTENVRQFAKDVETGSGGKLKIDLRNNDSLIKLDAIKRAVQSGQIQIGEIRLGVYGNEGAMYNLDNTPAVANDYDEAMKLAEAQKPYFDQLFGRSGMQVISLVPWPGQGFFTKGPVNSVADLKGQKLRIYSKQTQEMGEKLGMQALIMPFAEVPQAFATGMIQALWTSAQTGVDVKVWENAKYFYYTGTMHNKNAIIVNQRAFRQLDPALQKVVLEAGAKATTRGFELSKEASADREKILAQHGMVVGPAPKDVLARIDEIGQGMITDWLSTAKPEEKAVYEDYRKRLK